MLHENCTINEKNGWGLGNSAANFHRAEVRTTHGDFTKNVSSGMTLFGRNRTNNARCLSVN
jgi:hypothetical protein